MAPLVAAGLLGARTTQLLLNKHSSLSADDAKSSRSGSRDKLNARSVSLKSGQTSAWNLWVIESR